MKNKIFVLLTAAVLSITAAPAYLQSQNNAFADGTQYYTDSEQSPANGSADISSDTTPVTEENSTVTTVTTSATEATTTTATFSEIETGAITHETFEFDEVLSYPTKTDYVYGQELDFTGLEFTGVSKQGNTYTYNENYINGFHIEKTVSDKNGRSFDQDEFDTLPSGEYTVWITGSAGNYYHYNFCTNVYIYYNVTISPSSEDPSNSSVYVFDKVLSYPEKTVYAQGRNGLDLTGLKFTGKDKTGAGADREYGAEDCLSSITKFEIKDENGSGIENLSEDLDLISTFEAGNYTVKISGKAGSMNGSYNCHDVDITFKITIMDGLTASEPKGKRLPGDANCDEEVNMADAVFVMQTIANPDKYKLSELGMYNADVYEPGSGITNADALEIQRFKLGLIYDVKTWDIWIDDPTSHCCETIME